MNSKKIVEEIKKKYPRKKVILDPEDNPAEIICEIDPTLNHPEKSTALAIVGRSKPHYHKKSTEVYETIKGVLTIYE